MNKNPVLFDRDQSPFATGSALYRDSEVGTAQHSPLILVQVQPRPLLTPVLCVLDTAAPWCILQPRIGHLIADELEAIPGSVRLSTRLGVFDGQLYRGWLTLLAERGESLDMEATFFLSPQWRGSNFLGYEGALERIRFAVDPLSNQFYFGAAG